METEIHYGDGTIRLNLPDTTQVITLPPIQKRYEKETVRTALRKQYGKVKFRDFIDGAEKMLVIVNDAHRLTPTERILDFIYDKFLRARNPDFIVATGSHSPPDDRALRFIFGHWLDDLRPRIMIHDGRDPAAVVEVGRAKDGSPVELNRAILDYDSILVIGSIELHYFAGFTGGRKGFLPGISSYGTIERNHANAMKPGAATLALEGNPVHEGMEHAADLVEAMGKKIFSIQCILDSDGDIYAATAGDIRESFLEGARIARRIYAVENCREADVVVIVVPFPMDTDLYHSHKAIENARLVFAEGAAVILVSQCGEGLGLDKFVRLMESADEPVEIMKKIEENYRLGYHKTAKLLDIMEHAEMLAYTSLPDEELARVKLTPVHDLQEAIDRAIADRGGPGSARVMLIPDAGNVCPVCRAGEDARKHDD